MGRGQPPSPHLFVSHQQAFCASVSHSCHHSTESDGQVHGCGRTGWQPFASCPSKWSECPPQRLAGGLTEGPASAPMPFPRSAALSQGVAVTVVCPSPPERACRRTPEPRPVGLLLCVRAVAPSCLLCWVEVQGQAGFRNTGLAWSPEASLFPPVKCSCQNLPPRRLVRGSDLRVLSGLST